MLRASISLEQEACKKLMQRHLEVAAMRSRLLPARSNCPFSTSALDSRRGSIFQGRTDILSQLKYGFTVFNILRRNRQISVGGSDRRGRYSVLLLMSTLTARKSIFCHPQSADMSDNFRITGSPLSKRGSSELAARRKYTKRYSLFI